MEATGARVRWVLALGILCISFPAILFRYCDAPPVAAAFWRKAMAALILVPPALWAWRRGGALGFRFRGVAPQMAGAGILLALHFAFWFLSLRLTTVASSVVLVCTGPVWSALFARAFLGEAVSKRDGTAILVSMVGMGMVGFGDWGSGLRALLGDALALAAAACAAGYLITGRFVRERLPLVSWLLGVYAVAAACLLAGALASGEPLGGYDPTSWLMLVLMALIPSTLGHNLLNYAVRHMQAHKVQLGILVEPVVSTLLAFLLFAEVPGLLFYPGALLIFAAVALALR